MKEGKRGILAQYKGNGKWDLGRSMLVGRYSLTFTLYYCYTPTCKKKFPFCLDVDHVIYLCFTTGIGGLVLFLVLDGARVKMRVCVGRFVGLEVGFWV